MAGRDGYAGTWMLIFWLALLGSPRPARADLDTFWQQVTRAVSQIARGELAEAVVELGRARRQRALPELDALVGLAALAGGRREDALRQLASAASRATDPRVHYWAGRAAFALGHIRAARRHMRAAVAAGGDEPLLRMGYALVSKGTRPGEALDSLVAVARRWADLADPRLYPIAAEGAVELLESLLAEMPRRSEVYRAQGYLYWQLGRTLQAQERFALLVQLQARDGDALQMLALCAQRLGQTEQALELAKRAVERAPRLAAARATYGELLLQVGRAAAAVTQLESAVDARPEDAPSLLLLGQACLRAGDLACARKFFDYARRRAPRLVAAHLGLATAQEQLGDAAAAEQALARALALEPLDPRAYEIGAHLARVRGDTAAVRERLTQARARRAAFGPWRRASESAERQTSKLLAALTRCACRPRCSQPGRQCRRAVDGLSGPLRQFLVAHLALQRGERVGARNRLRRVLRVLDAQRLLTTDPCLVERAVRVGGVSRTIAEIRSIVSLRNTQNQRSTRDRSN